MITRNNYWTIRKKEVEHYLNKLDIGLRDLQPDSTELQEEEFWRGLEKRIKGELPSLK